MTPGLVDDFESAATDAGATVNRVPADEAQDVLDAAVVRPAVGAPLGFDGISLPPGVTTDPDPSQLTAATTGVTAAELGIADHGSVVVESTPSGEEPASLFPECHVAILAASKVVQDFGAAVHFLETLAEEGRDTVVVTGPSATADMGELVVGAHGPREVEIVLLEDR